MRLATGFGALALAFVLVLSHSPECRAAGGSVVLRTDGSADGYYLGLCGDGGGSFCNLYPAGAAGKPVLTTHQAQLPAAEPRNTARRPAPAIHGERCVLRSLPPRLDTGGRCAGLEAACRRRERAAYARTVARRPASPVRAGHRYRGQSVFRQPPRTVHASRGRHPVGLRRHGQRAVEGRPA